MSDESVQNPSEPVAQPAPTETIPVAPAQPAVTPVVEVPAVSPIRSHRPAWFTGAIVGAVVAALLLSAASFGLGVFVGRTGARGGHFAGEQAAFQQGQLPPGGMMGQGPQDRGFGRQGGPMGQDQQGDGFRGGRGGLRAMPGAIPTATVPVPQP